MVERQPVQEWLDVAFKQRGTSEEQYDLELLAHGLHLCPTFLALSIVPVGCLDASSPGLYGWRPLREKDAPARPQRAATGMNWGNISVDTAARGLPDNFEKKEQHPCGCVGK